MNTIYQKFKLSAKNNSAKAALYWKSDHFWHHIHYKELLPLVDNLAEGLLHNNVKHGDRICILSENRPEWLISDLAINKIGAVSVPIHTTSNEPLIEYIINDSGSGFLFVSKDIYNKFSVLLNTLIESKSDFKVIIYDNFKNQKVKSALNKKIIFYKDLIKNNLYHTVEVENELASIIYTSGTTGEPKGVMLSNENFIANIDSVYKVFDIRSVDKFLSILPLSHVLERTLGSYIAICAGASIAYSEGIRKFSKNLVDIKPTIMIGVPRIFEKTKDKIFAGIKSKNFLIQKLFFVSLKKDDGSLLKKIADKLIYNKIRHIFGGHLRFAVSGGAAIHERILRFYNNVGIRIVEGYGLTETSPIIACNTVEERIIGSVGKPLPDVEVKISYEKEILTKSRSVMMGYWGKPEMTAEVVDEDGWFKTGDLGFIGHNDVLTIIGRKKDLIVTTNGKNIYPEKIENVINLSSYIAQTLVVGHKKNNLAALIVPEWEAIKSAFGESVDVRQLIVKELEKYNYQLLEFEKIENFEILEKPFSIEENELTPTLKIRRHYIENKYKNKIDKLF